MKKILVIILTTVFLSLPAQENREDISPRRLKLAATMIELNGNLAQMLILRDQRMLQYKSLITRHLANITDRKAAEKMTAAMEKIIRKELDWIAIKNSIINIYAGNFSEAELEAIVVFYNSPAGKKIIKQNDIINHGLNQLFRERCEVTDKQIREYLSKNKPAATSQSVQLHPLGKISPTPAKTE